MGKRGSVVVAILGGVALLFGAIALGLREPEASLRTAPADVTSLDDTRAPIAKLRPVSEEHIAAQAREGRAQGAPRAVAPLRTPLRVPGQDEPPRKVSYPAAESCSVDNAGLFTGETRSCRFTATRPGGWRFKLTTGVGTPPYTFVNVTRGDLSWTYTGHGCGDAVVEPGDRVDVSLTNDSAEVSVIKLGAGHNWDCSHHGE